MLRAFRKNKDGMAAVEFALVLPVMLTIFFGVMEFSRALTARAAVTTLTSTVADLVAQEKNPTAGDMANVFDAAGKILYPFSTANATITVYSIVDAGNKSAAGKVAWSCTKAGAAAAKTGPTSPPAGSKGGEMISLTNLDKDGNPAYGGAGSVILTEVAYSYTSPTMEVITAPIQMKNTYYAKPRNVAQVTKPSACS